MNLTLLILNESDVSNLPTAAQRMLTDGTTHVWILASPAVTVSTKEATDALEEEIAGITKLMDAAAKRQDFAGADGYKKQLEAKQLDRAAAIAGAYKKVEKKVREKAFLEGPLQALIEPLRGAGLSLKLIYLEDHYDANDLANLLKKYESGGPFQPGSFGVRFARTYSHEQHITKNGPTPTGENIPQVTPVKGYEKVVSTKPPVPPIDSKKIYTGAELESMTFSEICRLSKALGVSGKGQPRKESIRRILEVQAVASL